MIGEIITIGNELISGRVCDLNSFFLSGRASSFGLEIRYISSVGDDEDRIIDSLNRAVNRSDFIMVSGGLGPTDDDITAEVAARFFNRELIADKTFLSSIERAIKKRGLPWVEAYRKMAHIPEGALLIDPKGHACGFYLHYDAGVKTIPVFFLPGVPAEVQKLAESKVLPILLADGEKDVVRQRVFKLFGLQEAQIGEMLHDLSAGEPNVLIGYYPNFPENHVTVTVRAATGSLADERLAVVESQVDQRLGRYLVAKDEATIESEVGRMLKNKNMTLAVAESCTGGLISKRLTSVSGSSEYFERGLVTYSNRSKYELLGVDTQTLAKHGAVSRQTAIRMAEGVKTRSAVSIGLATTGIAGPTGATPGKPVGTVYLALSALSKTKVKRYHFLGTREQITSLTSQMALSWLQRFLTDDTVFFGD
jgi:nicotinamide-nucleotide amidase